ncbi:plasmid segregation centromere-binding protein ParR [Fischerella thermalis WC246]|nr:plasmid segregation centromere-binding protein ParR [Fischerella thermalis WC119]PLZ16100.1 plasmid segregation centromere-binding protein ParR [Fischerella thermalis WC114]PLZ18807.1 plasmid segregation centromere-binding protein ParR [Fischerella thermalis WC157]PLZ72138.1 plasmid segregation centromere-binding protein ParR [Fischerella thermalis WC249]PLZ75377.1 plasmid segregation centromere-binding protein ParR [Fischerella thermalis WC246]PLZ76631.1 plasmid segregation centromere-bind
MADESLLALIESQLEKDPNKTFSDLCKEALWQALCVPESVRPSPPPTPQPVPTQGVELQISELQRQLADLEERFFAKESNRLEMMERHLTQLSQQVAQLAIMVHQTPAIQSPTPSTAVSEVVNHTVTTTYTATPPQGVDPVISRLSQYLDDF